MLFLVEFAVLYKQITLYGAVTIINNYSCSHNAIVKAQSVPSLHQKM